MHLANAGRLFREERDMFKSEAESLSNSLKLVKEECKALEDQLASQSAALKKIKTDTKKALQNESELRSHIERKLKCATEVRFRKQQLLYCHP